MIRTMLRKDHIREIMVNGSGKKLINTTQNKL